MIKINDYIDTLLKSSYKIDKELNNLFNIMKSCVDAGNRIWVLGNGGSLAIAQHLAQDLLKLCGVRAHAMNCPSEITAYANDDGFEYCFFNPVRALSNPGDVILIFSCSGSSRNYIEFVSGFADGPDGFSNGEDRRNKILSVVGMSGGFLLEKSDAAIHVKSDDYQVCETAFQIIADLIVKEFIGNRCVK